MIRGLGIACGAADRAGRTTFLIDQAADRQQGGLYVVASGGDEAVALVLQTVRDNYHAELRRERAPDPGASLAAALATADALLRHRAPDGTSCLAAAVVGGRLFVAYAGRCGALLDYDASPASELLTRPDLALAGLGTEAGPQIGQGSRLLEPGDVVVLWAGSSDNALTPATVRRAVRADPMADPEAIALTLADTSRAEELSVVVLGYGAGVGTVRPPGLVAPWSDEPEPAAMAEVDPRGRWPTAAEEPDAWEAGTQGLKSRASIAKPTFVGSSPLPISDGEGGVGAGRRWKPLFQWLGPRPREDKQDAWEEQAEGWDGGRRTLRERLAGLVGRVPRPEVPRPLIVAATIVAVIGISWLAAVPIQSAPAGSPTAGPPTPVATPAEDALARVDRLWTAGDRGDGTVWAEVVRLLERLRAERPGDRRIEEKLVAARLNRLFFERMAEADACWGGVEAARTASWAACVETLEGLYRETASSGYARRVRDRLYAAHVSYGQSLVAAGRATEARGHLERARELDSTRGEATEQLKRLGVR